MFNTTKNKSKNTNSQSKLKESPFTSAKSWLDGKVASLLMGSAIGYALYHFGIFTKIKHYFAKKPTTPILAEETDNSIANAQG